ncbi:MAG TPA: hypothetical protein VMQ76_01605 [Terracidiphilus sp.]|jgi:hypothetical protein|nr:hypothetical protein [Terracidiphilus sp.]
MKFIASVLYFFLLWFRGIFGAMVGLIRILASVGLVLCLLIIFVAPHVLTLPVHPHHYNLWPTALACFVLAFGAFMARYCYDSFLARLDLYRRTGTWKGQQVMRFPQWTFFNR